MFLVLIRKRSKFFGRENPARVKIVRLLTYAVSKLTHVGFFNKNVTNLWLLKFPFSLKSLRLRSFVLLGTVICSVTFKLKGQFFAI
jgi:hypothetical protein